MAFSVILRNTRLGRGGDKEATVDIAIADGRIAAIASHISGDGESVDVAGRFVSPGLVESHFHLDKSRILDRVAPLDDRRATDHMKRTSALKYTFTVEDIYARARETLEQCMLNGVMHMRTHVEVDPNVGLRGFEAIEQLAKDYAWGSTSSFACFSRKAGRTCPAPKQTSSRRSEARRTGGRRRTALRHGRPGQIERIFALANDFDVDVDIHLDGGHTTHDMMIWQVCDLTDRHGLGRTRRDRPRQQIFLL